MDYQIKKVEEVEFFALAHLYYKMVILNPHAIESQAFAMDTLMSGQKTKDAIRMGLYKGEELVGFATGFALSPTLYFWDGLYIEETHRLQTKELIDTVEGMVRSLGYTHIEADGATKEGLAMLNKYSYIVKATRCRKELV
jgi:hypothetical protein